MTRTPFFVEETRTCSRCGKEWEALDIWPPDVLCHPCQRVVYDARVAEINQSRTFVVESIGGACPTQAEGHTRDGRPFYFRARHGEWTLALGEPGAAMETVYDGDDVLAEGDDPSGGFMEWDDVLAVLDAHIGGAP